MTTARIWILTSSALLIAGATRGEVVQYGPAAALTIAKDYAETHFPKGTFQPDGARLHYFVEDAGEVWKAELGPVGYIGGGLQVIVRKRDMKVIRALRTQ